MTNYSKYSSYGDWYDNGPGSEAFKRKTIGTTVMPWDRLWDFSHYKKSGVRKITKRYKLVEVKDVNEIRASNGKCVRCS